MLLGLLKKVQIARSKSIDSSKADNDEARNGKVLDKENGSQDNTIFKQGQGRKYPPLKLVVMSASLDARGFSEYFGSARAVHIQGRQFPVDILYTLYPEPDYLDAALITIFQVIIYFCAAATLSTILQFL